MKRTVDERLEELLLRVSGKYKLVSLFQKRMRELQRGMPVLVESQSRSLWELSMEEILAGKIELIVGEDAQKMRRDVAARDAEEEKRAEKAQLAQKEA
jgi:DNA-directed RNA polymerase subunit K/omega